MNFLALSSLVHDKASAVDFLKQRGLLHRQRFCESGHEMKLHLAEREDRWRCNTRGCGQQKQLKAGTWLEGTHLTYETVVYLIYWWSRDSTTYNFCFHELSMVSKNTFVDWNHYMREVCAQALLATPRTIGGPGLHVEVDESLFVRRKSNVGRVRQTQWVVVGVCRENNECFLYTIEDRSSVTLNYVIEQACHANSTIITDEWPGYNGISNIPGKNFVHRTVNHSRNFVNPNNGACTNRIEGLWNIAKMRNKQRWGIHRQMVDSYLCEFMWRRRNHEPTNKVPDEVGIAIYLASAIGDCGLLERELAKASEATDYVDPLTGMMPIHAACSWGNPECVEVLVNKGVDINQQDEMLCTPMHHAARNGHTRTVQWLADHGANLTSLNLFGKSPVDMALSSQFPELADLIRRKGNRQTKAGIQASSLEVEGSQQTNL